MSRNLDRRRVNGPAKTEPAPLLRDLSHDSAVSRQRVRKADELRKIYLKTGLTPSASGSAYLELSSSRPVSLPSDLSASSKPGLKLACTVHGPRPLPRSAAFSSHLVLSTRIKFAPFATSRSHGFVPDAQERDLAGHLETALRGVLITERWPKSGIDVIITILEGDEEKPKPLRNEQNDDATYVSIADLGSMNLLSACITLSCAAINDAGIDAIDLVTGGVAAVVQQADGTSHVVQDPCPSDAENVRSVCTLAYLQGRDEITELWYKHGNTDHLRQSNALDLREMDGFEDLLNGAVNAAKASRSVLIAALQDDTP